MKYPEEVILPRRVIPQPITHVVDGGDCGACVLGGILGKTIEEVYATFLGKNDSFGWREMFDALWKAESLGWLDRKITRTPFWPTVIGDFTAMWGLTAQHQSLAWFDYLVMAFDAGYYAIALVDMDKGGMAGRGPNHWQLLVGARRRLEPFRDIAGGVIKSELLVSCSSRRTPDEEWVEAGEFLRDRGGFNVLLARPSGG